MLESVLLSLCILNVIISVSLYFMIKDEQRILEEFIEKHEEVTHYGDSY